MYVADREDGVPEGGEEVTGVGEPLDEARELLGVLRRAAVAVGRDDHDEKGAGCGERRRRDSLPGVEWEELRVELSLDVVRMEGEGAREVT